MEKTIKVGGQTVKYTETDEKKQKLWEEFIKWCVEHNAYSGESFQNDEFVIDAPYFMSDVIDDIIDFKSEWE